MNFEDTQGSLDLYPVSYYIDLLEHIKTKYAGLYWHVLPRELARFWKSSMLEVNIIITPTGH